MAVKNHLPGKVLFINANSHHHSNTARVGQQILAGVDYQTINLVDYHIAPFGQSIPDDQLQDVFSQMKQADTIIIGTPVYWFSMSALLKILIERLSEDTKPSELEGKNIGVFVQGADPSKIIAPTEYIIKQFANEAKMNYLQLQY